MKLTTYDDNQRRTERLRKALRIACAIMGITETQADLLIDEIADQRGTLTVRWLCWPITTTQRHAFEAAWRECRETEVLHLTADGKLDAQQV